MLKTYFRIAWRNIVKHRFYSFVNIFGLFAGITFTLLIGGYVWKEMQVNRGLLNSAQQYILTTGSTDPNLSFELTTFAPLAKTLKDEYPSLVANYYRFDGITAQLSKGDRHFRESIQIGDSSLLSAYGFPVLYGNAATALTGPFSLVISEEKAMKFFGRKDVVGESVSISNFAGQQHDFVISTVLKTQTENTVTQLTGDAPNELFVPQAAYQYFGRNSFDSWNNIYIASFVELQPGITAADLKAPIAQLLKRHVSPDLQQQMTVKPVQLVSYHLERNNGLINRMLYTLSFVAFFILLMVVVNFVNISISRSGARMKEIGIRKVLGGLRRQLIWQFLIEALLLVLLATGLAVAGYIALSPLFSEIMGKTLPVISDFPGWFICIPFALAMLIGGMAGLYPALVLSSMKSADSLKGKLQSAEHILLRRSLVGFQFGIALIVLVASGIITEQVNFFFSKQLGYDKEFLITSPVPRDWTPDGVTKMKTIRHELAAIPGVKNVSLSYEIPNGNNGGTASIFKSGKDSTDAIPMQVLITDDQFTETYQVPMAAGNYFNWSDSGKVVLNEAGARALGWSNAADAIGKQLRIAGNSGTVIVEGVSANFYFGSMQQKILPVVFYNVATTPFYRFLSFKMQPGNIHSTIRSVEEKWAKLMPGSSFEYRFMSETLNKMYSSEIKLRKAAYTSTVLSLSIVLLGVLGLVALNVQKRAKEIGIRKVLGAPVASIVLLFVKEFLVIMAVAALVASPVAWWLMNNWLNNYASRISIDAGIFLYSLVALGAITLLLIGLFILRTALSNPSRSLKTE